MSKFRNLSEADIEAVGDYVLGQIENKEVGYSVRAKMNANFFNLGRDVASRATKADVEKLKLRYYENAAALKADQPSPNIGERALVGIPYPGTVWGCKTKGIWYDTGVAPTPEELNLAEYAKVRERAIGDLISSGLFMPESKFTNIATESILDVEALTDWSGQYTGALYPWCLINGNGEDQKATVYVCKADVEGNIIEGTPGIIAQYVAATEKIELGIIEVVAKEVNFSGVNIKFRIDFSKIPPRTAILVSKDTILNSKTLLSKFEKESKEIALRTDIKDVANDETFLVNKKGDYKTNVTPSAIKKWNDIEWRQGLTWHNTSKQPVANVNMSISERIKITSRWLEVTSVPSSSTGIACFDKNGKWLGLVIDPHASWDELRKLLMYYGTDEISLSYAHAQKEHFSMQEISGVDFSIPDNGLYLVKTQGNKVDINKLSPEVPESIDYDYTLNNPIFFPQLFLRPDMPVYLHKTSLLSSHVNSPSFGVTLASMGNVHKEIDIQDPTPLNIDSIDTPARLIARQTNDLTKLVYKDIQVHKIEDISALQGKTVKLQFNGDSLYEGDGTWQGTPVCMAIQGLEELGITVKTIGSLSRYIVDYRGERRKINYEGRGGFRYRSFVGLESKFAGLNQIIPADQTKSEWVLDVDGSTMNEIKANNTYLYPATPDDLAKYPEWCFHFVSGGNTYNKSYAEDKTLGTYHIFDPQRYYTLRNIEKPDILSVAFGTNEWYLGDYGGFDLEKIISCFEFMLMRYRQALPNANILITPAQVLMMGREKDWKEKYSILCSKVMMVCENKMKAGDNRLFVPPIYAQGSRFQAFNNLQGVPTNISVNNSTKISDINQDVHYLYKNIRAYINSLLACMVNVID